MAIYLGIDGGGTKTACAVGDENRLLGSATAGGSNVLKLGEVRARESLRSAIVNCCASAHVDPKQVTCTCIGVAGSSIAYVKHTVNRFLSGMVAGNIVLVGDNEIALEAACGGLPGIVVTSGTGSIAYGRNQQGETARAGGHGFAVSDEGSGYWIGRAAVSAALRALDTGNEGLLFRRLGDVLGARSRNELVKVVNGSPAPDFSTLFPVVNSAAGAQDAIAIEVLKRAALELAQLAAVVIHRLFREEDEVHVGIAGGIFQTSSLVRNEFQNQLRALHPTARVELSVANPVIGALALARKAVAQSGAKE